MWTDFFADPLVGRTGWTLVHFVWQGALVALLLAAALRLIDERASSARYAAALAALVLMATLPVLTWSLLPDGPATPGLEASAIPSLAAGPSLAGVETLQATSLHAGSQQAATAPNTPWTARLNARFALLLPYLVLGWLSGVLVLGMRMAGGLLQVQRLRRRDTRPVDEQWQRRFTDLAQHLCPHRMVRLLRSTRAEGPLALGWWRPVVLVPGSLFTGLPPEQVEALLAHELAHLRRYDDVVNLLQSVLEVVLFYHPAVWWVSRQVRREREHCCDDLAAAAYSRLTYARALTELGALRTPALASGASDGSLTSRIRRIVGTPVPRRSRPWRVGVAGALTVLFFIIGGIAAAAFVPSRADAESTPFAPAADTPAGELPLIDTTLAGASHVRIALSGDTLVLGTVLEDVAVDLDSLHVQVQTFNASSVWGGDTLEGPVVQIDSLLFTIPEFPGGEWPSSFAFSADSGWVNLSEEMFALEIVDSLEGSFPEEWFVQREVPQVFFRFQPDSIAHSSPSQVFFGFWPDTVEHPAPPPPPRSALPLPPPRPDTVERPAPPPPQVFFRRELARPPRPALPPDVPFLLHEQLVPDLDSLMQPYQTFADTLDWQAMLEARQEALREWRQHREKWQEKYRQEMEEYRQEMKERMQALREEQQKRALSYQELMREQQEAREEAQEEAQRLRQKALEEAQRERQEALQELQREQQQEQREIQAEQAEALREASGALQEQAEELQEQLDAVEGDTQQALEKRNLLREQTRLLEQQARQLRERADELEDGR